MVAHTLVFIFLCSKWENKILDQMATDIPYI